MTSGVKTIIFPVSDIAQAKAIFAALLGVEPATDESYYVGYPVGGQDVGLDPNGHGKGMTGPVAYWHVDDIEASLQRLLDAGAETRQAIREVGGGRRVATVVDGDGNAIGLLQDA